MISLLLLTWGLSFKWLSFLLVGLFVVWPLVAVSLVALLYLVFWLLRSLIVVCRPFVFVVRLFVSVIIVVMRFLGSFIVVIGFFVLVVLFFLSIIVPLGFLVGFLLSR